MINYIIAIRKLLLKIFPDGNRFLGKVYHQLFNFFSPKKIKVGEHILDIQGGDFFSSEYEPEITEAFKKYIKPDWIVADVGANIGYHTLTMSDLAREVYSFEPCEDTFSYLLKNTKNLKNVKIFQKGLSDSDRDAYLNKNGVESGSYKIGASGEKIGLIRADDLGVKFDLIKMDIEGHEIYALKGMKKILESKPILIVEYNPIVNTEGRELLDFLAACGYEFTDLKLNRSVTREDLLDYKTHTNIICT